MMTRAVTVKGNKVTFFNIAMGFFGNPYHYVCQTDEDAFAFGKYLEHQDQDGLPSKVTNQVRLRFSANEIITETPSVGFLGTSPVD